MPAVTVISNSCFLCDEIIQRGEEGCQVDGMHERLEAAGTDEAKLMEVYQALMAFEPRADFKYIEPSELKAIRAERPDGPRILSGNWDELKWQDKFYGAWLGRSAGCALGKPLEAPSFMQGSAEDPAGTISNCISKAQGNGRFATIHRAILLQKPSTVSRSQGGAAWPAAGITFALWKQTMIFVIPFLACSCLRSEDLISTPGMWASCGIVICPSGR